MAHELGLMGRREVPGVGELRTMCENAARVARLCELLGSGAGPRDQAGSPAPAPFDHTGPPDGAWILPEEV